MDHKEDPAPHSDPKGNSALQSDLKGDPVPSPVSKGANTLPPYEENSFQQLVA